MRAAVAARVAASLTELSNNSECDACGHEDAHQQQPAHEGQRHAVLTRSAFVQTLILHAKRTQQSTDTAAAACGQHSLSTGHQVRWLVYDSKSTSPARVAL
jgi:hypothetical protein